MGNNDKIKNRYNRISGIYNVVDNFNRSEKASKWREKILARIEGQSVLEIGVGAGKDLLYYPEHLDIVGIDFSRGMLERARERTKHKQNIEVIEMDAQDMGFEDNHFDTVVTSCVFCSVPDPVLGLKEIRRVCKNNGKIIMVEHMRSNNKAIGKLMDIFNFIPLNIWGANINRRTMENLIKAGFNKENIKSKNLISDIFKLIEIRNEK